MTICEDVSLIARSLGLVPALTMRDKKSGGYPGMCVRKPSDNLDVMVLPSTLESLAACSADRETGSPRRTPERKVSMGSRVADALVSRTSSAAKDLALALHANRVERDASAVVLQERVRFQLVQRYRARHSPVARARKVRAAQAKRRPLFASVFERFGIGYFTPPPPCAIDLAIDRITGTDHRPIPPLHSPHRSFSPHCFPKSRYEYGRVLVHTQFERSLDRSAAGELRLSSSE